MDEFAGSDEGLCILGHLHDPRPMLTGGRVFRCRAEGGGMASNVELAEATASDGAASLLRKATVRADMPRDICTIVSCIGNPVVCGMQQLHLHSVHYITLH